VTFHYRDRAAGDVRKTMTLPAALATELVAQARQLLFLGQDISMSVQPLASRNDFVIERGGGLHDSLLCIELFDAGWRLLSLPLRRHPLGALTNPVHPMPPSLGHALAMAGRDQSHAAMHEGQARTAPLGRQTDIEGDSSRDTTSSSVRRSRATSAA
jgi:hypothetical protein